MDVTELAMLLDSMDVAPVDIKTFMAAAEKAKRFKLDDEQKLQLYGLFKQSSVGKIISSNKSIVFLVVKAR